MKKGFHHLVLAISFAGLGFLALAGTIAHAVNYAPPKASSELEQIREQIRTRNATDGGCG